MALVSCPGCKKEISDKATKCINCGYILKEETVKIEKKCSECGAILGDDVKMCPNCGCPAEDKKEELIQKEIQTAKASKNTKKWIMFGGIAALVLIIAALSTFFIIKANNQKKAIESYNEYIDNVNTVVSKMLRGAAACEDAASLIHDVWSNSIMKESSPTTDKYTKTTYSFNDFNTSLGNLFADSSFQKKIDNIKKDKESINAIMKKLQNPPSELRDCYDAVVELNEKYNSFASLATDPTGSLTTYTSSYNSLDADFMTKYNTLKNKIPEKR
ncbi:MAG: hypothetical protein HFJ03_13480 [Lachnospira sp.]|nr:hypothetical protein [Lachnospira sp.]